MCFLCCLTLITMRRYVTMHCLSWNGGQWTVRDRTATVWRRCRVAADVVVIGLTLRGGGRGWGGWGRGWGRGVRLLGRCLFKNRTDCSLIRSYTVCNFFLFGFYLATCTWRRLQGAVSTRPAVHRPPHRGAGSARCRPCPPGDCCRAPDRVDTAWCSSPSGPCASARSDSESGSPVCNQGGAASLSSILSHRILCVKFVRVSS